MGKDDVIVLTVMAMCILILIISPFVVRRYKRMNPKPTKKRVIDQQKVNDYINYGACEGELLKERKAERRHREIVNAIWQSSFIDSKR